MKFDQKMPPREFVAGYENKVSIHDCGTMHLAANEQVTFLTEQKGEFDVARKSWGFYATPSMNGRLVKFGLRSMLARNRDDRYFVLLVEKGKEEEFYAYAKAEPLTLICWLDETENLKRIESLFGSEHDAS